MAKINMKSSTSSCSQTQFSDAVKKKAYELYEKSGRKSGRDLANWLEAEKIVRSQKCSC